MCLSKKLMMVRKNDKINDLTLNKSSPYFLYPTNTCLKIVSTIYDGVGFKRWKRAVSIALSGMKKLGFIDASIKRSTTNESHAKAWDRVNDIVIGWLLNAMSENISRSVLWITTAKGIWDELEQRFGQSSSAQLFTVQEVLSKATQGPEITIEDFFTKMKGLWDEINALDPIVVCSCTGCTCNLSQKVLKSQQSARVIQFLL